MLCLRVLAMGLVALVVACGGTDEPITLDSSSERDPSTDTTDQALDEAAPASGQSATPDRLFITVTVLTGDDGDVNLDHVADRLSRRLDHLDGISVTTPGPDIVITSTDVEHESAIVDSIDIVGNLELRPVLDCGLSTETQDLALEPGDSDLEDILPTRDTDESCLLGAVGGTGEVFSRGSASPTLDPQQGWGVSVDLSGGGQPVWNDLAAQCFNGGPTCPSRQLAIVLDDVIQSAPVVNAPSFQGAVSITGNFSEVAARQLADDINLSTLGIQLEIRLIERVTPIAD